jgi:predicted nucleotidyltransferase
VNIIVKELIESRTIEMSLEDVIERLSKSSLVSGVLQIGSLSKGQLKPGSDYDLFLVTPAMFVRNAPQRQPQAMVGY